MCVCVVAEVVEVVNESEKRVTEWVSDEIVSGVE